MSFHYRYRKQIILGIIILTILGVSSFFVIRNVMSNKKEKKDEVIVEKSLEKKEVETKKQLQVDIKGEIINPGIYELDNDSRVIDVINKAGGLTENANTSVINLSKKITDEMVIIIYSNEEVNDFKTTKEIEEQVIDKCIQKDENSLINDACIENDKNEVTGKININTASLEELMKLPGVGESKAKSIIEYRETKSKFNTIEDIKNVNGIGDNLFAQIKENITT
ncbi:MAG: helix-hairpin-helix domain-containing protein [Bacilli bacterium]|nr:helix-hairpin-helix domain-containing protein [Bacilli bacterium]